MAIFVVPPASADVQEHQKHKMPNKKKHARATQLAPQPAASDYDTDTAYNTENQQQLPVAPPPDRSAAELNMLVLKRWYPDIQSILAIAPFAVLYSFSPDTQQWDKCDTQGSLFVCQLASLTNSTSLRYRVIILNRRNPKNFELDLVSTEDIEITKEFVIIPFLDPETGTPQIYGIWVFKDAESEVDMREYIAKVILECASMAEQATSSEQYAEQEDVQNGHSAQGYGGQGSHSQQELDNKPQTMAGQSIDLATLFARPAQGPELVPSPHHFGNQYTADAQRSTPAPDTAFFQNSSSPAASSSQGPPAGPQQNTLLNLFKNAKKG